MDVLEKTLKAKQQDAVRLQGAVRLLEANCNMQSWSFPFTLSWQEKNDKIAELEKQMAMKAGHHEKKALALSSFLCVVGGCGSTKFNVGGCSASEQRTRRSRKKSILNW